MTRRNDPCPCGSGKRFKDCCLGNNIYKAIQQTKTTPGKNKPTAHAHNSTIQCSAFNCSKTWSENNNPHEAWFIANAWALCPYHAKRWMEKGLACSHLKHYKAWEEANSYFLPDYTPTVLSTARTHGFVDTKGNYRNGLPAKDDEGNVIPVSEWEFVIRNWKISDCPCCKLSPRKFKSCHGHGKTEISMVF